MFDNVSYPVSKARAAYWAGRAAEAGGKPEISLQWFAHAASHVTSFYGQLAAAKLAPTARPSFPPEPKPTIAEREAFAQLELVRLVKMLSTMGLNEEINPFVRQLARGTKTARTGRCLPISRATSAATTLPFMSRRRRCGWVSSSAVSAIRICGLH